MNLRVEFVPVTDAGQLSSLREQYLDTLTHGQEALLEALVAEGTAFLVRSGGKPCGYFILHADSTLIEFHLLESHWVFGEAVFKQILAKTPVRRALVKSFDALLLSSCIAHQRRVRCLGLLVRDYIPRALPTLSGLRYSIRQATLRDLPAITQVDQQVFANAERLLGVVETGQAWLFERAGQLLGFGILRPVVVGRPEVDVGIAVDRPYRARGFAVYMLRDLVERCVAQGLVPVAGCAEENRASRHSGERIGLVSRHRLLELSFDDGQAPESPV